MEPTLKAPTAENEKKPWIQLPKSTVLSFNVNNPGIFFAAHGATVSSSPVKIEYIT
jgi:hypothetical protein